MAALVKQVAPIKYAQRKDSIYLTIDLPDLTEESISLTADKLDFSGKSNGKDYTVELVFMNEVDPDTSTWKVLQRSVQMHIMKKDQDQEEFWVRLLKDKVLEKTNVKIDWDKYVDEDEETEGFDPQTLTVARDLVVAKEAHQGAAAWVGGMDMAAMQKMMASMGGGGAGGMPGMGDMGGDDEEFDGPDSDDEGVLPDLDDGDEADESENVD
eukprot:CAMPEP_0171812430 /NCGR_PEP_ID=MMETSP0991-20121206/78678_1 /TAXON_ID=483369 /ORGANISM="non described non described, Strain CCMP2098" /LENGTH=210 /DNA_ID=CAMNT_0012425945 /DNA_START=41 /DNA_END=674 /DNA_ORIENTATION=-